MGLGCASSPDARRGRRVLGDGGGHAQSISNCCSGTPSWRTMTTPAWCATTRPSSRAATTARSSATPRTLPRSPWARCPSRSTSSTPPRSLRCRGTAAQAVAATDTRGGHVARGAHHRTRRCWPTSSSRRAPLSRSWSWSSCCCCTWRGCTTRGGCVDRVRRCAGARFGQAASPSAGGGGRGGTRRPVGRPRGPAAGAHPDAGGDQRLCRGVLAVRAPRARARAQRRAPALMP